MQQKSKTAHNVYTAVPHLGTSVNYRRRRVIIGEWFLSTQTHTSEASNAIWTRLTEYSNLGHDNAYFRLWLLLPPGAWFPALDLGLTLGTTNIRTMYGNHV